MPKFKPTEGIKMQPRDRAILRTLLDSRIMTIKHAAALHFGGSFEAAKKRLQKLQKAGLIVMRPRRVQDPAIYSLTRSGYLSLKEEGMLDPLLELGWEKMRKRLDVSEFMLRHELAVMDVKAALAPVIEKTPGLRLMEFTVRPERHAFRATHAIIDRKKLAGFRSALAKPDGFLYVAEGTGEAVGTAHYFFLEVDRSTETLKRLVKKAQQYSQHYRKGSFAIKRGFKREEFKLCPFRVLMIFLTAERRNNVAAQLLKLNTPVNALVWLATMSEALADPLGKIWIRPADYATAIRSIAARGNRKYRALACRNAPKEVTRSRLM